MILASLGKAKYFTTFDECQRNAFNKLRNILASEDVTRRVPRLQKNNAKIKRWKALIDDTGAKLFYKPGKENHVANALSRENVNALQNECAEPESDAAAIHSQFFLTYTIDSTEKP